MPPSDDIVKRRALHFRGRELALAGLAGKRAEFAREIQHALLVDVPDHGDDEAFRRVDGDAEMPILSINQGILGGAKAELKVGKAFRDATEAFISSGSSETR